MAERATIVIYCGRASLVFRLLIHLLESLPHASVIYLTDGPPPYLEPNVTIKIATVSKCVFALAQTGHFF
jgi:hypothetical protein